MGVEFQHPTPFPSRKKASSKFDVNFPTEPNNPINLSDFEENTGSFISQTPSWMLWVRRKSWTWLLLRRHVLWWRWSTLLVQCWSKGWSGDRPRDVCRCRNWGGATYALLSSNHYKPAEEVLLSMRIFLWVNCGRYWLWFEDENQDR